MSYFAHANRPELSGPYAEVFAATRADVELKSQLNTLDVFFVNWSTEFIHGFEHDLRRKYDLNQNIYLAFLATQTFNWDWMSFELQCGNYSAVARELRAILESTALFIGIELRLPSAPLTEKMALWQSLEDDHRSHGKIVFRDSGQPDWEDHYALYRELCSYTHPSIGTYRSDIEEMAESGQMLPVSYDRVTFLAIYDLWLRVVHVITVATERLYSSLGEVPECCATNPMDEDLVRRQG